MQAAPEHFKRLHPLTPLLRGWAFVAVAIGVGGQDVLRSGEGGRFAVIVVFGSVLGMAAGLVSWWFTRYGFDGDALRIDSGVLNRRSRRVRLDRLQAVDINRPLVGRFLGVSELRLEVAGGGDSEAPLQYLSMDDATKLRAELLARAAGIESDTPEAPERVIHEVPLDRLVWSTFLSIPFALGVVILAFFVAMMLFAPDQARFGLLSTLLPGMAGIVVALWNQLVRNFSFVLSESPDGYRIRKGLLDIQHQTVPPGRIQGVVMREPLLWRFKGWAKLEVEVAGYAGSESSEGAQTSTLLPVADVKEATDVLRSVFPASDIGHVANDYAPTPAHWLRPVGWRRLAFGVDHHVVVVREGVITRKTTVVPHVKMQSVRVVRGPLQRALGLASVHIDSPPGPVNAVIRHRFVDQAWTFADEQAERARTARQSDIPEQWMARREQS